MAQIDFNSIHTGESSTQFSNSVDFFSLKNDGDTAIVRFMHDSTDTFELLTVHDITLNDKYRKANCIRQPNEPLENCPLCATGKRVQQRFFIHLIQYVQDSNGNIIGIPKVWERPASYAYKLKNLIDEYGPLSDSVFKVIRNGAKGSKDTTYDIMFCNPAVYNSDYYVKDGSAFENYSALGRIVLNKNFEELLTYVNTGSFPEVKKEETPVATSVPPTYNNNMNTIPPNTIPTQEPSFTPTPQQTMAPQMPNNTFGNQQPFNQTQQVQRPIRSYNN